MQQYDPNDDERRRVKFLQEAAGQGGGRTTSTRPQGMSSGFQTPVPDPYHREPDRELRPSQPSAIRIAGNIVDLAKNDDAEALHAIFGQFISPDEKVVWCGYLGKLGLFFGRRSFACLTDKRVADISIGWFGEIVYQDALLEYFNSTVVYQPSRLSLYIWTTIALGAFVFGAATLVQMMKAMDLGSLWYVLATPVLLGLLFLMLEVVVRLYYLFSKCGLVLWIKEGISVYIFSDRKLLTKANSLIRLVRIQRDQRIAALGHIG